MTATIPSFQSEESSVSTLAQLAMHLTGADGYALYALDQESGALIVQFSAGASLPQPQDLAMLNGVARRPGIVVISYPFRLEGSLIGTLAFSFRGDSVRPSESKSWIAWLAPLKVFTVCRVRPRGFSTGSIGRKRNWRPARSPPAPGGSSAARPPAKLWQGSLWWSGTWNKPSDPGA